MIQTIENKGGALACTELDENFKSNISLGALLSIHEHKTEVIVPDTSFIIMSHTNMTENQIYLYDAVIQSEENVSKIQGHFVYDGASVNGNLSVSVLSGSNVFSTDVDWDVTVATFGLGSDSKLISNIYLA